MLRHGVPTADPTRGGPLHPTGARGRARRSTAPRCATSPTARSAPPRSRPARPLPPVLLPGAAAMLAAADSSVALARLRGVHPLGARGPLADPRRTAAARGRPRRRRGARPRPLLPRPRPRGRRAARDHAAAQLGPAGPVRAGRPRTAGAGQERGTAAVAADRDVEAGVRGGRRDRRALRRLERLRGPVAVRDEPRRGVPDAAHPALRRGRRADPAGAVPPGRARGRQRPDGLRRRRPRGRRRATAVAPRRHRAARRAGAARRRAPRGEQRRRGRR